MEVFPHLALSTAITIEVAGLALSLLSPSKVTPWNIVREPVLQQIVDTVRYIVTESTDDS